MGTMPAEVSAASTRTLQERFDEAEDTLRALRAGEVDAIVAAGPGGDCIYTLRGADQAYRIILESMAEGALTLTVDGLILFSNERFAAMLRRPLERVIGSHIQDFVTAGCTGLVEAILGGSDSRKAELQLATGGGPPIPVYASAEDLVLDGAKCLCLVVTDLTGQMRNQEVVAAGNLARAVLEREAEELERRVDERTTELRQALLEKTALLQEVHHRVRNNLQVIGTLLSMQIDSTGGDAHSAPLRDAYGRVLAMSLVHEQIHQYEHSATLNFGDYMETLSARVFGALCIDHARIRLELDVEGVHLVLDDAVPAALILNELLTNSLKHAFENGRTGIVRVFSRQFESGRVEIGVADDGVGLPVGLETADLPSIGMKLVRTLANQLKADLVVSREGGTAIKFNWEAARRGF
jgi:two-component sensor histidine kinase